MPSGVDEEPSEMQHSTQTTENHHQQQQSSDHDVDVEDMDQQKDEDENNKVNSTLTQDTDEMIPETEEGVEVVLGERGSTNVVDEGPDKDGPMSSSTHQDQSIFRHPHPVRPRAMRAPTAPPPMPQPPHVPGHPTHPAAAAAAAAARHRYGAPPGAPGPAGPHQQPQPYVHGSGSWGYGPPPPQHQHHPPHPQQQPPPPPPGPPPPHGGDYPPPPPRPYTVPPYNSSGSFDDQGAYHQHHTPHYSPHVQYPPPGGRYASEDVNVISPNHKVDPHYRPPPTTARPRHMPPNTQPYYQYPPTSPVSRPGGPQASPMSRATSSQPQSGPPRLRNYAMRRGEGAYSRAQRDEQYPPADEGSNWNSYPAGSAAPAAPPQPPAGPASHPGNEPPKSDSRSGGQPPVVAESFDSEHHSNRSSQPPTPSGAPVPPPPPSSHDPHYQFYGGGGSWGSFDSAAQPPPPVDEQSAYYHGLPPDSPYSPYAPPFSPGAGGLYRSDSFPPSSGGYGGPPTSLGPPQNGSFSYSYDEDDRFLKDYPQGDGDDSLKQVTPPGAKCKGRSKSGTPVSSNTSNRNMILPKAAEEINFCVTDPPMEPVLPPSDDACCESLADVNGYDVLCGRGGGTNSQIGNRRFRKLVQEFQPTYLMAKRKEKPLLARTIVLIIRKRGGRFLKKNEDTGELFEVGDSKAEAKTSQALREGLDVRATKSAASSLVDKKKKKKSPSSKSLADEDEDEEDSPSSNRSVKKDTSSRPVESPPTLPRLQGEEVKSGSVHPHSPEQPQQYRKRRRMRSTDRFFPDFCPPRAELGRTGSPTPEQQHYHHYHGHHQQYQPQHLHQNPHLHQQSLTHHHHHHDRDDGVLDISATTPVRRNSGGSDESIQYDRDTTTTAPSEHTQGCAGIALDIVTGAATGSFCLGPTGWRN